MHQQAPARRFTDRMPACRATDPTRPPLGGAQSDASPEINFLAHATISRMTHGISPVSLALAWSDWALHLTVSPGSWMHLGTKAVRKQLRLLHYVARCWRDASGAPCGPCEPCIVPLPQDRRFDSAAWQRWPFNLIYQGFLLEQQWWQKATTGIPGVSAHHEQVVSFVARQMLDMASPVNFIPSNPELLSATFGSGGLNLLNGAANLFDDLWRGGRGGAPTERFRPGRELAVTPGQVVFRNRLIELIQYSPVGDRVHGEPILVIPAWIMKFYILDLSPANSLVRFLVGRGHTVFMISWHNPDAVDRDLGMDDYLHEGVFAASQVVNAVVPGHKINAVGYCLGGTLLSIAAALVGRSGHTPFKSLTLLAAQTDFSDAGELTLFIDESEVDFLESLMWQQGYLDTRQMAGAFELLRSNELLWSRMVNEYLLGKRGHRTDLMAWNADTTRMPYRMHSDYLRRLFLRNDLFEGRYSIGGQPAALGNIDVPVFLVATETDHVAPWRSVYKFNLVADTEVTFILTSGGHNAGIVSEPGHRRRHYRHSRFAPSTAYVDPAQWLAQTPATLGSWWLAWANWLEEQNGPLQTLPSMGAPEAGFPPLGPAPGDYVLER